MKEYFKNLIMIIGFLTLICYLIFGIVLIGNDGIDWVVHLVYWISFILGLALLPTITKTK